MKTRTIILLILAAAAVMAAGCDELLSDLLKFNGEWFRKEFTINPSDEVGDLIFTTEDFLVNLDSLLDAHNLLPENLRSAEVSDARVVILSEGQTFDPVSKVEFFMESPGLGNIRVAWIDPVPRGQDTVFLELSDEDLQDYLFEDVFRFTASGTLNSTVDDTVDMVAEIRFVFRGKLVE